MGRECFGRMFFNVSSDDASHRLKEHAIVLIEGCGIMTIDIDRTNCLSACINRHDNLRLISIEQDRYRGSEPTLSTMTISPVETAAPQMP